MIVMARSIVMTLSVQMFLVVSVLKERRSHAGVMLASVLSERKRVPVERGATVLVLKQAKSGVMNSITIVMGRWMSSAAVFQEILEIAARTSVSVRLGCRRVRMMGHGAFVLVRPTLRRRLKTVTA